MEDGRASRRYVAQAWQELGKPTPAGWVWIGVPPFPKDAEEVEEIDDDKKAKERRARRSWTTTKTCDLGERTTVQSMELFGLKLEGVLAQNLEPRLPREARAGGKEGR